MIHRYFFAVVVAALLVASAAVTSIAQVGELRGHVWLQQADGQKVPLADANIDVFRMDLKAEYKTKTNKKGEFVFAGLPLVGTYTVAASHPSAQPSFIGDVKVGREIPADLTLAPGDGKRLTAEEVKGAAAGPRAPGAGRPRGALGLKGGRGDAARVARPP